jgi:sigma-B regulation protein RsbU (phosphoserine phosphatase)
MRHSSPTSALAASEVSNDREILFTLFDLGRKVASVLDADELLPTIPELVGRLIPFDAFALYLLDEKRDELTLSYAVGYPEGAAFTLPTSDGTIGRAVTTREAIVVGDVTTDPHYISLVPGIGSALAVPLIHKAEPIGALNVLCRDRDRYSDREAAILRQFGAHVAAALVNARLFARQRRDAHAFETLAEIGREVTAVLDLDELLSRIAQLARRVIDYRTFGIMLLNERTDELEMTVAVKYGAKETLPKVPLGEGLVGYAALHREPVLCPDVSKDPRYIKVVDDVRSELVIPMVVQDRTIGVFDLESPELDRFSKRDAEILTLLASQAAVAIENARLYKAVSASEARMEKELRFAQRVQAALLPTELPKRLKGVDVAAAFAPARELGGDFHDFLVPVSNRLVVALGDVSGKGVPAALYGVLAGELVRGRTFRLRYLPQRSSPADVLTSINTILHERQLEEYYCTLCYAAFDLKRERVTLANSGLPYPIRASGGACQQIELPGVPLGSFYGVTYDQVSYPLKTGDTFVFCSDGVFEAMNRDHEEFGAARLMDVVTATCSGTAREVVDAITKAVHTHRAGCPPNDDTTIVVVRIGDLGKR